MLSPVISGLWGLPEEVISTLLIGFLRKDVAVALLEPLNLSASELTVTTVILTLYFPCAATFAVFIKEMGLMDTVKAVGIMMMVTLTAGTFLNLTLERFLSPLTLAVVLIAAAVILGLTAAEKAEAEEFEELPAERNSSISGF